MSYEDKLSTLAEGLGNALRALIGITAAVLIGVYAGFGSLFLSVHIGYETVPALMLSFILGASATGYMVSMFQLKERYRREDE